MTSKLHHNDNLNPNGKQCRFDKAAHYQPPIGSTLYAISSISSFASLSNALDKREYLVIIRVNFC